MEGDEVWVVETWEAHGEGAAVLGVYVSREAAFEAVNAQPNMTAYVDYDGVLLGRPRRMTRGWGMNWEPVRWALGRPHKVQGRKPLPTPAR